MLLIIMSTLSQKQTGLSFHSVTIYWTGLLLF